MAYRAPDPLTPDPSPPKRRRGENTISALQNSSFFPLTLPFRETLRFPMKEARVFSIGEFSRVAGLTVKALRFYHEEGLLVPAYIDPDTGYRYYAPSQLETARVIAYLRGLDFPVSEIGKLLAQIREGADLLAVVERQRASIDAKIRHLRSVAVSLDKFIAQEREAVRIMSTTTFKVQEKTVGPILVAGVRMKGKYSDCGQGFSKIGKNFWRHIAGKPMLLIYDHEYKETDADFEPCMPVKKAKTVEGISVRELPGGRCVTLVHQGPYDQLGRSYAKILQYIKAKGYAIDSPCREVYLKGPGMIFKGNPKKYLTEIQMFVREGK